MSRRRECTTILVVVVSLCVLHECACAQQQPAGAAGQLKPLPTKSNYSASASEYDDGGMGPLYNFARSFINTALPGGFPVKFMNETLNNYNNGKFGVDNIKQLLGMFSGYVAAIAVGILFIVVFPVVGACFCCCRMCGNCGGSSKQSVTGAMHMKRRVFTAILFVLTTFTLVGNICTYVSNSRMTVALDKIGDTVANNLDDLDSYLDLVQAQVETIGIVNLDITKNGILKFLNQSKLEQEITTFALDGLSGGALTKMQKQIEETGQAFDLIIASKTLITNLAGPPLPPGVFTSLLSDPKFGTLDAQKTKFDTFRAHDLIGQLKTQVTSKISGGFGSSLGSQKNNIDTAFKKINDKVMDVVQKIRNFRQDAKGGLDLNSYKQKARSYTDNVKTYDKYRYMAAAGLAGITTLVVTLQFLGLAFGFFGQGWSTEPAQRGCVSGAGGNFLMASVGFIFLFSSLLMLLTTICFSLGAILERFVCQPLSDDDLQLLKLADSFIPTRSTLNADLSDILKDCRDDKSAYKAFRLNSMGVNLTMLDSTLDSQKQQIDTALQTVLTQVGSIGTVSFGGVDIADNLKDLQDSLTGLDFNGMKAMIQNTLRSTPVNFAPMRGALQNMLSAIETLDQSKSSLGTLKTTFKSSMDKAASQIGGQMATLMGTFKKDIINVAEVYVNSTKNDMHQARYHSIPKHVNYVDSGYQTRRLVKIRQNMGRCSPVWNLYDSILVVAVCKYTVDSFNGFWFSIGWCLFFFVPSAVFSVKLAKHYRRMNAGPDKFGTIDRESSFGYDSPIHRRNQVGHMDDPPIQGY